MSQSTSHTTRSLAVTPSTRGFGFAVLEGEILVDWGVKPVTGDKNTGSVAKVKELLILYHPARFILEDAESSRRAARICALHAELVRVAKEHQVRVIVLTRTRVRRRFFADGEGTKHELALQLAERYPEELKLRLPPKRRLWMSEDYRMGIFDAVALGLAGQQPKRGPVPRG